jgi:Kef-type K+ transport system membrane component KefB
MKLSKKLIFYLGVIGGFTLLIFLIIHFGEKLENQNDTNTLAPSGWNIGKDLINNLSHPLSILLLQIVTIILFARLFAWICKKLDQPTVIGEIAAGIILGPSLLGMYLPEVFSVIFPASSLNTLQFLSQIGLILFMFVVGMELDLSVLKDQAREAVIISHASIIIPFTLGTGLAYFIYSNFAPDGVPFISFGLFMGISMSITAFPVLARIVQERGIHKSRIGTIAITCAAVDDITAWSLLAMVIAIVNSGSLASSLVTISLAILYVLIALKLVKPFLKRISDLHPTRQNLNKSEIAIFFLVLIGSAYLTEIIGIHALFGAFMAGVIMPNNQRFKQILIEKIEDIALVLLLPLFFVYTGLRTEIGLLDSLYLWSVCGLVVVVAVIGKFGGSTAAARFVGQNWKDSFTIGALMNTRGLVELVALNIGYDLGILTPEIFTMLVLMALITTIMTAPSLNLIDKYNRRYAQLIAPVTKTEAKFRILISFGNPEMGRVLLRMIHRLANGLGYFHITALHLFAGNLFTKYKLDDIEKESFSSILNESKKTGLPLQTIFKVSDDITADIISETKNKYDLLLVGIGKSIYEGTVLGRILGAASKIANPLWLLHLFRTQTTPIFDNLDQRTQEIVIRSKIPAGILINKNLFEVKKVLIVLGHEGKKLIDFLPQFIHNRDIDFTFLDKQKAFSEAVKISSEKLKNITYSSEINLSDINGPGFDLIIFSLNDWLQMSRQIHMKHSSILILKL